MSKELNIPNSWEKVKLPEVVYIEDHLRKPINSLERQNRIEGLSKDSLFPYFGATGQVGVIDSFITNGEYVLIGEDGAPFFDPFRNKAYEIKGKTWVNNHAHILKTNKLFSQKFLLYYLNQFDYRDYVSGTTRLKLTKGSLENFPIPIPPLKEQNRIVVKIEELFSDLDNGVTNLKLVQNQLKVYRQALLKHAFEGKLTEQWRKENNSEPAEKLLERIKKERKNRYEQGLKDWKDALKAWEKDGKKGKKPVKPKTLIIPTDIHELSKEVQITEIKGKWSKVGIVAQIDMGQSPSGESYNNNGIGTPLVNGPVEFGKSPFSKTLMTKWTTEPTKLCKKNDLILCVRGSTTGRQNIAGFDGCIGRGVCAIRSQGVIQEYINHFFNYSIQKVFDMGTGSTFPSISGQQLNEFVIPIYSNLEQKIIVEIVEQQFSIIDNLEETINSSIQKSEALRHSILKKGFEGQLVAQDPNDEPASKLLKRILSEKKKYLEEQKQQKNKAPKKIKMMSKELSIEDVLKTIDKPMLSKEVWQQSKHKGNIEEFYAELKKIQKIIKEVKRGTESFLSLTK